MSKVELNALIESFSGKLGNTVLKRRGKITYIVQKPIRRKPPTPAEQILRLRFQRAVVYSKAALQDPVVKAHYASLADKGEFLTPYSVAIEDYLKAPIINPLKLENYQGRVGDVIGIPAFDNGGVVSVAVTITSAANVLLEQGEATLPTGEELWQYRTTVANGTLVGTTIVIVAKDRPGNETLLSTVL